MPKNTFHSFYVKKFKELDSKCIFNCQQLQKPLSNYEFFNLIFKHFIIFNVLYFFMAFLQRFRNYFILNTTFVLFL